MIVASHRRKNILSSLSMVMLSLALTACAGDRSYTSMDTGAQVADQGTVQEMQPDNLKQLESLTDPPKRGAQDPIYVKFAPPVLDKKMQQIEKRKGTVAQRLRNELASDPIIQLVPEKKRSGPKGQSSHAPSIADVDVASTVSLKEVAVVNRKTGKPRKAAAVVFEATITSQVPPASYTVSETGLVLENTEVSKRFVNQVRQVIIEKIGPGIPAH
jgi:hypothetical protein